MRKGYRHTNQNQGKETSRVVSFSRSYFSRTKSALTSVLILFCTSESINQTNKACVRRPNTGSNKELHDALLSEEESEELDEEEASAAGGAAEAAEAASEGAASD